MSETAAASGFTLADFFNVVHFRLDEASLKSAEDAINALKHGTDNGLKLLPELDKESAESVIDGIKGMTKKAQDNADVPIKPEIPEKEERKVVDDVKALRDKLTNILGAIGIGFSLMAFREITEEFNAINDSINYATRGLENQKEVQKQILEAANDAKMAYGDLASYATRLAQQNGDIFPIEDATEFAKLVAQVETAAGSADGLDKIKDKLGDIFAKNRLELGVLEGMAKDTPEAVEIIMKGLGVTREELNKLAESGKLTSADIKRAYFNCADSIQETFENLDYSLSDGLTRIRNSWGYALDEINIKFNITGGIAKTLVSWSAKAQSAMNMLVFGIESISDAVGGFDNLMQIVLVTTLAFFTAWKGQTVVDSLKNIITMVKGLNLSMLPTVATVLGLFLVFQDLWSFLKGEDSVIGKLFEGAGVDADALREKVFGFFSGIKQFGGDALESLKSWWSDHGDEVKDVMQALFSFIQGGFNILVSVISGLFGIVSSVLNGDMTGAVTAFKDMMDGIFSGIDEAARALFGDGLVDTVEGFITWAWGLVEGFFGFLGDAANAVGKFISDPAGTITGAFNSFFGKGDESEAVASVVSAGGSQNVSNNENTVNQTNNYTFNVSDHDVAEKASGAVASSSKKATDQMANELAHSGR